MTSEKLKLYDDYKDGRMGRDLYKQRAEKISGQLDEIKRKIEDAEKTTTFINNKIWETDAWKTSIEKVLYLTGSKRSENEEYINTLNNIAIGKNLKQCVSYINTIVEIRNFAKLLYEQTGAVYLTAYRNEVDAINEYHVAQHKLTDQLDVTWDIGTMGQSKHHIAHDYFNLTDELMNQDHKADSSLPECKSKKANYYVQRGCSFQMRHRLMAYIDRLIEKNERIYEFRAEGRLNKVAIEKEVADHIVQKLHEQERSSVGIKTCSNRELGIYRIEIS